MATTRKPKAKAAKPEAPAKEEGPLVETTDVPESDEPVSESLPEPEDAPEQTPGVQWDGERYAVVGETA